ncbi:HD domain-containing protein [Vannielia litorea]|uniref:HD domain-containing protein n=1 Tax=Vannielia litorea TaxID=1217970 RepID=UPI001C93FDA7|nr:HD domain-containing protein [Vannielia litorea]MBY6153542.1 HD domain-containing protein [Vannielia litorea]
MGLVGDAFELALSAHAGQTDKAGAPYIAHVVRVTARADGDLQKVVALLHDVVEDCDVPLSRIEQAFGSEVAGAVDAITRRDGEEPDAYYARVTANPLARSVKLCDIADNADPARLALLPEADRHRLEQKYTKARAALGA